METVWIVYGWYPHLREDKAKIPACVLAIYASEASADSFARNHELMDCYTLKYPVMED